MSSQRFFPSAPVFDREEKEPELKENFHPSFEQKHRDMAKDFGVLFPTILPIFQNPLDKGALKEWVNFHETLESDPELHKMAQRIADNITCVSFKKFLEQLQRTINDFLSKAKGPYVLYIAEDRRRTNCSDTWVPGLAFEYCGLPAPEAIVSEKELAKILKENSHVKNILLLDDAAYSGAYIDAVTEKLKRVVDPKDHTIYVGIPFMTTYAKKKLSNIHVLANQLMPSLEEIFNEDDLEFYRNNYGDAKDLKRHTITYFDHKLADGASFSPVVKNGLPLFAMFPLSPIYKKYKAREIMFIPKIFSPYKLPERFDKVIAFLVQNNIRLGKGKRDRSSLIKPSKTAQVIKSTRT